MADGILFDIQRFSLHDGPGIRTNLFFKGCPLRCRWCHNPEGLRPEPELSHMPEKCIGCGACARACRAGAHRFGPEGRAMDRTKCVRCGACADVCAAGALVMIGKRYTVREAVEIVMRDAPFYRGVGGATLTGGEPMAQAGFALEISRELAARGVGVCVETCGHADPEALRAIALYAELFLFDIKETDADRHRMYTGAGIELIRGNLFMLDEIGAETVLRCPVIPCVNDRGEHFEAVAGIARSLRHVRRIDLMPYHALGIAKRARLGLEESAITGRGLNAPAIEPYRDMLRARVSVPVNII